jgi:hypothetical protein
MMEDILKSLTTNGDGFVKSFEDISPAGIIFLCATTHLMKKKDGIELSKHRNIFATFKYLSEDNRIVSLDRRQVLDILSGYVDSGGSLIGNKKKRILSMINNHINVERETKKPKLEQEWLTYYKSQCAIEKHTKIEMATILGLKDTTFRSKIVRYVNLQ